MRPKQWVKNTFVLSPLVFSSGFTDYQSVNNAFLAMALFCFASSAAYIVNDYCDIDDDRNHPVKSKTRPLASGHIPTSHAFILLAALYIILAGAYLLQPQVVVVIVGYLILNLTYSLVLKHQPVFDIFSIATGFMLRVYAGAVALAVPASSWMLVTTFCLAIFLATMKRRQELVHGAGGGRKVLRKYTVSLLDRFSVMAATGALLFYSVFVLTTQPLLVFTIPIVLFGLFRFWLLAESLEDAESPTDALYTDWQLLASVVVWAGCCIWVLWPATA